MTSPQEFLDRLLADYKQEHEASGQGQGAIVADSNDGSVLYTGEDGKVNHFPTVDGSLYSYGRMIGGNNGAFNVFEATSSVEDKIFGGDRSTNFFISGGPFESSYRDELNCKATSTDFILLGHVSQTSHTGFTDGSFAVRNFTPGQDKLLFVVPSNVMKSYRSISISTIRPGSFHFSFKDGKGKTIYSIFEYLGCTNFPLQECELTQDDMIVLEGAHLKGPGIRVVEDYSSVDWNGMSRDCAIVFLKAFITRIMQNKGYRASAEAVSATATALSLFFSPYNTFVSLATENVSSIIQHILLRGDYPDHGVFHEQRVNPITGQTSEVVVDKRTVSNEFIIQLSSLVSTLVLRGVIDITAKAARDISVGPFWDYLLKHLIPGTTSVQLAAFLGRELADCAVTPNTFLDNANLSHSAAKVFEKVGSAVRHARDYVQQRGDRSLEVFEMEEARREDDNLDPNPVVIDIPERQERPRERLQHDVVDGFNAGERLEQAV